MPAFDTNTPTISRKFYDMDFTVPAPFTPGHALTANEANFLNSNVAGVVGNSYSGDIRRAMVAYNEAAKEAHVKAGGKAKDFVPTEDISVLGWDHQAKFAAKYADYELGVSNRGGGGSASDSTPLGRMITFLATEDLKARMLKKGLKVAAFYKAPATEGSGFKSKWGELLAGNIEAKREEFTATAQAQLDAIAAQEGGDTEDSLLDGLEAPAEVEAEPEAA